MFPVNSSGTDRSKDFTEKDGTDPFRVEDKTKDYSDGKDVS